MVQDRKFGEEVYIECGNGKDRPKGAAFLSSTFHFWLFSILKYDHQISFVKPCSVKSWLVWIGNLLSCLGCLHGSNACVQIPIWLPQFCSRKWHFRSLPWHAENPTTRIPRFRISMPTVGWRRLSALTEAKSGDRGRRSRLIRLGNENCLYPARKYS